MSKSAADPRSGVQRAQDRARGDAPRNNRGTSSSTIAGVRGQSLVQLPQERLAAIGEMFPGVLAVEDDRAQRIGAVRAAGNLLDLAHHEIGRPMRVVA